MPLTFIDIERQKNWRIGIFFLVLMLLYFVIILALAIPFFPRTLFGSGQFWPFGLLTAVLVAAIHFFLAGYDAVNNVVTKLDGHPPDSKDDVHRILMNIMEEMHVVTGGKRPIQCVVIPSLSLNALAAADLKGAAVIGITEGLLSRLSRPQLEAVIAHEAHHILSGDCLETTIVASLFGPLSSLMDKYSETPHGRFIPHPALLPAWVLLKLGVLLNLFISREREYRADAAAVRMTRNPVALAETLHLLSRSWRGAGFIGSGYEMLCIVNPQITALDESDGFWADLFSTHPPIRKRIELLLSMARISVTELELKADRRAQTADQPAQPVYYALTPQQQWQGPFTLAELGALPWLSPLTWITSGNQQSVDRAWKEPVINALFALRLSQNERALSDLACPSCQQPLIMESYEGTHVDRCRFCAGTLVENIRIPRILARTNRDRPCTDRVSALARAVVGENHHRHAQRKLSVVKARPAVPRLACPKCKNPMHRTFFSAAYAIDIDRCSFCGLTWFDQDELEMLQCLIENRIVPEVGNREQNEQATV
jgi:heat shock protein HtpX